MDTSVDGKPPSSRVDGDAHARAGHGRPRAVPTTTQLHALLFHTIVPAGLVAPRVNMHAQQHVRYTFAHARAHPHPSTHARNAMLTGTQTTIGPLVAAASIVAPLRRGVVVCRAKTRARATSSGPAPLLSRPNSEARRSIPRVGGDGQGSKSKLHRPRHSHAGANQRGPSHQVTKPGGSGREGHDAAHG